MKKILLFDLDGTLFNTKPGIVSCVRYTLETYGIYENDERKLERFIGPPLHRAFADFYGFDGEKATEAAARYRARYKDDGIFDCIPYDGIYEALAELKAAGIRLGVATSKPEVFANRILEKFEMDGYFESVTGSLLDNTRSDKAQVIAVELERMGAWNKRDEVVMVGDRSYDIVGAKQHGLTAMGVRWGFAKPGELEKAGADLMAEKPGDMMELVRKT